MEEPGLFGGFDHGQSGTVLHAPTGIEELKLGQKVTGQIPPHSVEPDERRFADQVEERTRHLHGRPGVRQGQEPHPRRDGASGVVRIERHRQSGRMKGHGSGQGGGRTLATNDTHVPRNAGPDLRHGGGIQRVLGHPDDMPGALAEAVGHVGGSHHDQDVHSVRA